MFVSQIAGLLTDNFELRRLYVSVEACNLVLATILVPFGNATMLFVVNIALGLVFAFSQPVTKAMPPAIISVSGDLAKLNAWDLTCDKVPLPCSHSIRSRLCQIRIPHCIVSEHRLLCTAYCFENVRAHQ